MSNPPHSTSEVVRFGTFEVDVRSGELRKAGVRIALQDQPLRVLTRLIQRPGEVVTREELQRELWPDNTFLDFEQGLNAAIKRLRDALGDSAESPRFVETLPRRGYRFIAPVVGGVPSARRPAANRDSAQVDNPLDEEGGRRGPGAGDYRCRGVVAHSQPAGVCATRWSHRGIARRREQGGGVAAFENSSNDSGLDPLGDQIAAGLFALLLLFQVSRPCRQLGRGLPRMPR